MLKLIQCSFSELSGDSIWKYCPVVASSKMDRMIQFIYIHKLLPWF